MNSVISVDINKVIPQETDLSTITEECLALVCEQRFLIDITLEQALPQIRRYTEDNFGCNIKINNLCTIEGHTAFEVKIKHFAVKEDANIALSILKADGLVFLMKDTIKTLATLLPFPYSICNCFKIRQMNEVSLDVQCSSGSCEGRTCT